MVVQLSSHDLIQLGFKNEEIGNVLQYLLKFVLNQQDKNKREVLLKVAGGYKNETINR